MPIMNDFEATRAIHEVEKERDGRILATIIACTELRSGLLSFKEISWLADEL